MSSGLYIIFYIIFHIIFHMLLMYLYIVQYKISFFIFYPCHSTFNFFRDELCYYPPCWRSVCTFIQFYPIFKNYFPHTKSLVFKNSNFLRERSLMISMIYYEPSLNCSTLSSNLPFDHTYFLISMYIFQLDISIIHIELCVCELTQLYLIFQNYFFRVLQHIFLVFKNSNFLHERND